jgi:hypothetical protein
MFALLILLCSPTECISATVPTIFSNVSACEVSAGVIRNRGLNMIDRGEIEPHTFQYKCIAWGNPL